MTEKWFYSAITKLSALSGNIILKYNSGFHCLNWIYYFKTKVKRNLHEKVCKNNTYCEVAVPNEELLKVLFLIYVDFLKTLEKIVLLIIIQKHYSEQK